MKLLDLINEETIDLTDKERKKAKSVYKVFQTGKYVPFPDMDKLKYVLPDFQSVYLHPKSSNGNILMHVPLKEIEVYIITDAGNEVNARKAGDEDSSVIRNVTKKIKSRFLNYDIIVAIV
jgi:hypothetical protein